MHLLHVFPDRLSSQKGIYSSLFGGGIGLLIWVVFFVFCFVECLWGVGFGLFVLFGVLVSCFSWFVGRFFFVCSSFG